MEGQEELEWAQDDVSDAYTWQTLQSSSSFALNHSSATLSPHVLKDAAKDANTLCSYLPLAWARCASLNQQKLLGRAKVPMRHGTTVLDFRGGMCRAFIASAPMEDSHWSFERCIIILDWYLGTQVDVAGPMTSGYLKPKGTDWDTDLLGPLCKRGGRCPQILSFLWIFFL